MYVNLKKNIRYTGIHPYAEKSLWTDLYEIWSSPDVISCD